MKANQITRLIVNLTLSVLILGLAACQKKEIVSNDPADGSTLKGSPVSLKKPYVSMRVSNITASTFTCYVDVSLPGGASPVTEWGVIYSSSDFPIYGDGKCSQVVGGTGTGSFVKLLEGLANNTVYTVRAYAINAGGLTYSLNSYWSTTTSSLSTCAGSVTDDGGHTYSVVQIGNQCWMAQNLNYGAKVAPGTASNNGQAEKYCYNNLESNCDVYGALYDWDELMAYQTEGSNLNPGTIQGLCPEGWHIPSMGEMTQMMQFLGGGDMSTLGGELKETGISHWKKPNTGATNEYGFTVLGSGTMQKPEMTFSGLKERSALWTSARHFYTTYTEPYAWSVGSFSYNMGFILFASYKTARAALPVRCVKDAGPTK